MSPKPERRRGRAAGRRVRGTTKASSERPSGWLITWTSIRARLADHASDHRPAGDLVPARATARTHHGLRRASLARAASRSASGCRRPTTSWYAAAQPLDEQRTVLVEQPRRRPGEAVLRDGRGRHEVALGPLCDPRRAPDEVLATRRAGQRDHDPLARLPRRLDAVARTVLRERLVDPVGDPGNASSRSAGGCPAGSSSASAASIRSGG